MQLKFAHLTSLLGVLILIVLLLTACQANPPRPGATESPLTPSESASTGETPQAYLAYLNKGAQTQTAAPPDSATGEHPQAFLAYLNKGAQQQAGTPTQLPAGELPEVTREPAVELALPFAKARYPARFYFPDSEVVYSPSALDFDLMVYLKQAGGILGSHQEYLASSGWSSAAAIIERVAIENSVNPRLLTALLEYQCGCVLGIEKSSGLEDGYILGVMDFRRKGLYGQAWWAANQLSQGYYGWKEGWLKEVALPDGRLLQPPTGMNPGSVALQVYFARLWQAHDQSVRMGAQTWAAMQPDAFDGDDFLQALDLQAGFLHLYRQMFGDSTERAQAVEPLLPPGLRQPVFILPFEPGRLWSFASGPHQAWEKEGSLAALDFAPATQVSGCEPSNAWVVAVADGPVVRVGPGLVVQDLDAPEPSDNKEQTGWAILYMHIAGSERVTQGTYLRQGQRIGHPSCEGGPATGTHVHIARKYNGEWVAAAGELPFVLDGWLAQAGSKPYEGSLVKDGEQVIAHPYGSYETHIRRPESTPQATASPPINDNNADD